MPTAADISVLRDRLDFLFCFFKSRDDSVAPGVEFGVFFLTFFVGEDVVEGDAYSLVEAYFCVHGGYGVFQFGVVKDDADGFVSDEGAFQVVLFADFGEEVRGYVVCVEFYAEGVCYGFVYLIPGEGLVGGDVECFADCVAVCHEADVACGEVAVEGEGPEGAAVSRDQDRFAFHHSFEHLI